MKDKFYIIIESFHADGRGDLDGVHGYTEYERRLRLVVPVDISSSVSCNVSDKLTVFVCQVST